MVWPASDVDTTQMDAGTDTPPRAEFLSWAQKFNQLRNHVSAFMQGLLTSADAAAARTTLGATTTGAAVFTAANAGAARTALGATTVGANVFTAADAAAARSAMGAADAAATVNLSGAQTVAGLKTFSGGHLSTSSTQPIGYAAGAGGTFTQLTSKTTSVAVDRPSGIITTHNASLAAGATVTFIAIGLPSQASGCVAFVNSLDVSNYEVESSAVHEPLGGGNGFGFRIRLTNISAGARSENLQIQYALIGRANL